MRGPVAGGMVPGGGHSGTCAADLDVKRNYPTQEHTTLTPTTQCNIFTKNTYFCSDFGPPKNISNKYYGRFTFYLNKMQSISFVFESIIDYEMSNAWLRVSRQAGSRPYLVYHDFLPCIIAGDELLSVLALSI